VFQFAAREVVQCVTSPPVDSDVTDSARSFPGESRCAVVLFPGWRDPATVSASAPCSHERFGMTSTASKISPHPTRALRSANLLALDPPSYCTLDTIVLSGAKFLVGASSECDICLQAEGVHDRHAVILVGDRRTVVKALDQRTWLNDGPLSESALRPGDRLSIGPLTFRVRRATADELAAFVASSRVDSNDGESAVDESQTPVVSVNPVLGNFDSADSFTANDGSPILPANESWQRPGHAAPVGNPIANPSSRV
jgi:Inner membrane component of T3SS, cytoplasmic domain